MKILFLLRNIQGHRDPSWERQLSQVHRVQMVEPNNPEKDETAKHDQVSLH